MPQALVSRVNRLAAAMQARAASDGARGRPVPTAVELFEQTIGPADDWQRRLLASTAPRVLLNVSRQGGKSLVAAATAYHTAVARPGSQVLIVAPAQRQAVEALRKVLVFHRAWAGDMLAEAETQLRLELVNGSRVIALPGSERTTRGFSAVDLLIIDEAARVDAALYLSVRPMLAVSGGRLLALSTPFGARGWFYEAWRSSENWERYEVPATECPRIAPAFLEEERRTLGEWWFEQEYLCQFVDGMTQSFSQADVDRAFSEGVEAWAIV